MATCAREGFGNSNEGGVFIAIGESVKWGGGGGRFRGGNFFWGGGGFKKKKPFQKKSWLRKVTCSMRDIAITPLVPHFVPIS